MKTIGISLVLFMMVGCSSTVVTVCPTYPKPNKEVRSQIGSLNNGTVDAWMQDQRRLYDKLKICNKG